MKILLVSNGYPIKEKGGVEQYTQTLARTLSKNNEVIVFTREWDHSSKELDIKQYYDGKIKVYSLVNNIAFPLDFEKSYKNQTIDKIFEKILLQESPQIAHIQHTLGLSIGIMTILHKKKIPFFVTLHDFWYACSCIRLLHPDYSLCKKNCVDCYDYYFQNHPEIVTRIFTNMPKSIKSFFPRPFKEEIKYLLSKVNSQKKIIVTSRNKEYINSRKAYVKKNLSYATYLISPSKFVKHMYKELGFKGYNIKLLPLPLTVTGGQKKDKKKYSQITFGYLGTFYPFKGIQILINAFKNLSSSNSRLVIYGDYSVEPVYYKNLKQQVKGKNVEFKGPYNNSDVFKILSGIDVLVIPTLAYETFNYTAWEALISKTVVIASNIGAIPECIKHMKNGLLFPPGDEDKLLDYMRKLTKYSISFSPKLIKQPMSSQNHGDTLIKLYQNAIEKKK